MIWLRLAVFILGGCFIAFSMLWTLLAEIVRSERPPLVVSIASLIGTLIGCYLLISTAIQIVLGARGQGE
jgi:drug/metabolite transporter superfamily protein YnfA